MDLCSLLAAFRDDRGKEALISRRSVRDSAAGFRIVMRRTNPVCEQGAPMASRQLDEEAIFHIARQLADAESRSTYLDEICAGDQALRERVEALLEVQSKSRASWHPIRQPRHPRKITCRHHRTPRYHYRPLQADGVGRRRWHGSSLRGRTDRPIRRKVALKVIKPGMDSKAVVARFEAERQALAMMDHPNIAKVLDGGTTDSGRPYFVMELVRGCRSPSTATATTRHSASDSTCLTSLSSRPARTPEGHHSSRHQANERAGDAARRQAGSQSHRLWRGQSTSPTTD